MKHLINLLLFSFSLLLLSSFNFAGNQESLLTITRVYPICVSFFISNYIIFYLITIRNAQIFVLRSINTPFCIFYILFILVNSFSGIFSGISVDWMLWKNFELLNGVFWFISFYSLYFYIKINNILEKIGFLLIISFLSICTYEVFFLLKTYSFLDLLLVIRPEIEVPKINAIRLSILATFITIFSLLKFKGKNFIWLFISLFGMLLIIIAKSRTGFLAIILFFFFEQYIFSNRVFLRALFLGIIFTFSYFFLNKYFIDFASIMRIDDFDSLSRGGGRLTGMDKQAGSSSWGESLEFISNNFTIGIGNINTKRFLDAKIYSVDNFILQNFIAGGILGGGLLSFWAFLKFPFSFWRYFKINKFLYKNYKVRFATLMLIIFFVKSFSTNGASFFGIEFLFLGLSYAIFNKVKSQ